MSDRFGRWVTDSEAISHFNEHSECTCGNDDISPLGRFYELYWCSECERQYVSQWGDKVPGGHDEIGPAVHPESILETSRSGLVPAEENWKAFSLLTEQDIGVQDYIEPFHPAGDPDAEAWLWAHDELFIGYLTYRHDELRTAVIADGFRRQGHGKAFLEAWYEQADLGEVDVIAYDRTIPFLEKLDIPFNIK